MRDLAELGADPLLPNADNCHATDGGRGTRYALSRRGRRNRERSSGGAAGRAGPRHRHQRRRQKRRDRHARRRLQEPAGRVEFLAGKGAKIEIWNQKNKYGWTPLIIAEGHRFGNYKPSPGTVAALHKVMKAAGVSIEPTKADGISAYK